MTEQVSPPTLARDWLNVFKSLQLGLVKGSYIRTINFHNTPLVKKDLYERQLAFCQPYFSSVSQADLDSFFSTGAWHKDKPGLIPVFYEGYRNNFDVAAPLAEKYGFVGWFFVPSAFPSVPVAEQRTFAEAHHIGTVEEYDDGRIAMTWDELRELDKKHVIACHTKHHERLTPDSPDVLLRQEIIESKRELEQQLGHEVSSFAWLYGSEYGVNAKADSYVREAGYRYLFSNFKIQKLK
jgi:peptidoglycan/xylan/chitin deacetylase (PgdA/CDA1 family)